MEDYETLDHENAARVVNRIKDVGMRANEKFGDFAEKAVVSTMKVKSYAEDFNIGNIGQAVADGKNEIVRVTGKLFRDVVRGAKKNPAHAVTLFAAGVLVGAIVFKKKTAN